jgi:hypothetical protein
LRCVRWEADGRFLFPVKSKVELFNFVALTFVLFVIFQWPTFVDEAALRDMSADVIT